MRSLFWRGPAFAATVIVAFAATAMAADEKKTEKKIEKKPPSICVGLDTNACGTKADAIRSPPRPARCAGRTVASGRTSKWPRRPPEIPRRAGLLRCASQDMRSVVNIVPTLRGTMAISVSISVGGQLPSDVAWPPSVW